MNPVYKKLWLVMGYYLFVLAGVYCTIHLLMAAAYLGEPNGMRAVWIMGLGFVSSAAGAIVCYVGASKVKDFA